MRGADSFNEALFCNIRLEEFVPANHTLRPIFAWLNEALTKMDARFSAMYEADVKGGRLSIAPEKLMRAMLLQCCTASTPSAYWSNKFPTTCCSAGSSAWLSRCGTTPCSARTVTD